MPISSFYGLQTSLRGLLAQQRSLDVTGHNISNVNTSGYSRQEAALVAAPALFVPAAGTQQGAASLGSGVDVQSYRRVRDTFLDLDKDGARALGEQIQRVAPRSKVILWARDETVMEVLESVSRTPRLVAITVPEGLRNELSSNRHRDQVEE